MSRSVCWSDRRRGGIPEQEDVLVYLYLSRRVSWSNQGGGDVTQQEGVVLVFPWPGRCTCAGGCCAGLPRVEEVYLTSRVC
jgi:hypothetical protein